MRVLESTEAAGELAVTVVLECPDPSCAACTSGWATLDGDDRTTHAVVVDRDDVSRTALRRAVHDWLDRTGVVDQIVLAAEAGLARFDGFECGDVMWAVDQIVDEHVALVQRICEFYPVGAVLSRLGDLVAERVVPRAA